MTDQNTATVQLEIARLREELARLEGRIAEPPAPAALPVRQKTIPEPPRDYGTLLKQADIDELKVIYRKKYGKEISDEKAWEMGNRLMRLFAVLLRLPIQMNDQATERAAGSHRLP